MAEFKFSKSLKKLEEIIEKIENEEIDVDELASSVKQAVELITVCKEKIEKTEMEVSKIVKNLDVKG